MDSDTAYQQALDYLYSFVDYSLTRNLRYSPEKFDLSRMRELVSRLGSPHLAYPIIHVAGTKGKGSTAALIASALKASGRRVGLYTSPHLEQFNERIQVDDRTVSNEEFVDLVEQLKPHAAVVERITTFELTTAAAFLHFAANEVDVAVVEVGLGGRLDATNIITPLVAVITSLSMDHTQVLGDTLEKIAAEKGGIIKPGRPVVLSPQQPSARMVIEQIAAERAAPLLIVDEVYTYHQLSHSLTGQTFDLQPAEDGKTLELSIPLLGAHQVENAVTAYAALRLADAAGLEVSDLAVREGFAKVRWPARFEVVWQKPVVVLDSAHNRDSAARLRQAILDYLPGRPVTLLFGASEDKDISGMLEELLPSMERVIATESVHPRAMKAAALAEVIAQSGQSAQAIAPIELALESAMQQAGENGVVLVTGSLFVAAAARQLLLEG